MNPDTTTLPPPGVTPAPAQEVARRAVKCDTAPVTTPGRVTAGQSQLNGKTPDRTVKNGAGGSKTDEADEGENGIEFFFDKTKSDYWRRKPNDEFQKCDEKNLRRHCQRAGMNVIYKQGNAGLTRFDLKICDVQDNAAVDHAIPLSGHRAGIFTTEDGRKILVPCAPRLVVPVAGDFPNFEKLMTELFGETQHPYIVGWLKIAVEDLYRFNPSAWRHSQMLALVGKPNCGKSFFQSLISIMLGGRTADPYLWAVGKSDFNEEIAESEHLMMEDKHALRDSKSRSAFGTAIKQLTVTSQTPIHGKGKKMFTAPAYRRLSFSVNEDADYITALPMLDDSIGDKLMLMKCSKAEMLPDYSENKARFVKELPAFVHYLLNVFTIPKELRAVRFGVIQYHSPEVVEMLQQFEPHIRFREVLDATLFKDGNEPRHRMSAAEITTELLNGPYGATIRPLVSYPTACGQLLAKCQKEEPERFTDTKSKGNRRWTILAPAADPE